MVVSDGTFQPISIKHSGFNPDSVIEASFKVLNAVPDIMNKVQLFQECILTDAEQLARATGATAYRWEDLAKAPVSPSMLLNPRRYGDGAKDLWTTLNCVETAEHNKNSFNGGADQTLPRNLGAKIAMQYFRFLPDPAKLRKEARWSGCPPPQVSASAYSPRLMSEPEP
jgi:hypothetical protein